MYCMYVCIILFIYYITETGYNRLQTSLEISEMGANR